MTCAAVRYRAFTHARFANDFVNKGRFRLGRLDHYRRIEDSLRADPSEGLGHYVDRAGVNEYFERGEAIYVLCCSAPEVERSVLRQKGEYVAKIADPNQLAGDIGKYLADQGVKLIGQVSCRAVEYTKGEVLLIADDPATRANLSIVQKHPRFAAEKEERIYAISSADDLSKTPIHLEIDLQRRLQYVELLTA